MKNKQEETRIYNRALYPKKEQLNSAINTEEQLQLPIYGEARISRVTDSHEGETHIPTITSEEKQ
jgi:hypothetical protein